jgi:hypothetical protein
MWQGVSRHTCQLDFSFRRGGFSVFFYAKTNRIGAPIVAHLLWDVSATLADMALVRQFHFDGPSAWILAMPTK